MSYYRAPGQESRLALLLWALFRSRWVNPAEGIWAFLKQALGADVEWLESGGDGHRPHPAASIIHVLEQIETNVQQREGPTGTASV